MLILTEKPSVARAFADALGVPYRDGFWENGSYCITNALGHLLENFMPEDYDPALKKWSIESLPIIPDAVKYKAVEKTKAQLAVVKKCFDRHKNAALLLATDAEREGELIGAEILDYAGFDNYANARRFWVSEALTQEVILAGIKNAKPLAAYESYKKQGYARQYADWLIGMNLTRLVSLKSGKLLHFGRVQTAVLGVIYEREKEIANFTKEKYYEIKAVLDAGQPIAVKLLNKENSDFPFRFSGNSSFLKEIIEKIDAFKSGIITNVETEKKTIQPPQLFNLTALQKEAHRKHGYTPEQTLDIAQSLYEKHKCLSYPRTPSRVMGDDNVNLVKGIYEKLETEYQTTETDLNKIMDDANSALIDGSNKRIFNSEKLQDHHALIPLAPLPNDRSDEERNVYTLVFERFFTVLKPPYIYNAVKVFGNISGYEFLGQGIEILQPGWKTDKAGDEDSPDDCKYTSLPENGEYAVIHIAQEEKQTEPKKYHTYASLLQLMENPRGEEGQHLAGLGTPATRGSILQKLVDRKYVFLKNKNILTADDGKFLIENIIKNDNLAAFISLPETTRWEEQLHENTSIFLDGIKKFVRSTVSNTEMDVHQSVKKSLGKCPVCKGEVYEGKKNYYCSNYKEQKPCAFTIWKEICGAAVSPADAAALLSGKHTKVKKCLSKKSGKEFQAAFKIVNGKVEFQFADKK